MMIERILISVATVILPVIWVANVVSANEEASMKHVQPISDEAPKFFSIDYEKARAKFRDAATVAGARIESYKHPTTGPMGAPIYTDVAVLGSSDAEAVLFVGAGTHGVEGFAGSAIQTGLLRRGFGSRLSSNTRLVLIHAINPFGFAYLRRANEDNIDVNRNFRDHAQPYPPNPGYDALADAIAPDSISVLSDIAAISRLIFYAAGNGIGATTAAITSGQYTHRKGLFFGGDSEACSAKTLRTIVQRHGNGARKVAFVDVHTGLGPYGHGEIILNVPEAASSYERAFAWWGERVKTTKAGKSVSADLTGTLKLAIPKMLPGAEVTAVSLEFGTVPSLKALRALRAENWLHHHGGKNHPESDRIKSDLLKAFYPDADDWRAAIWRQGEEVVNKALQGLSE